MLAPKGISHSINPKSMDEKIKPNAVYTTTIIYISNENNDNGTINDIKLLGDRVTMHTIVEHSKYD